jgi:hypothetical protein
MKKHLLILLFISLVICNQSFAQYTNPGKYQIYTTENNALNTRTITVPVLYSSNKTIYQPQFTTGELFTGSYTRWSFIDPIAIDDFTKISANGLYQVVGWDLNTKRVSVYNNNSSTPLWEYTTNSSSTYNYVAISDTGAIIAVGAWESIMFFNRQSNVPFFTFNTRTLPDTGLAGPLDLTSNGKYMIATSTRSDTSTIFCFNKDSANAIWTKKVPTGVYGVNISRNDSLVIVNTYSTFYVLNTFTGQQRFQGTIQGTQTKQGISGNGNIVASIDYYGWLRVYQWNGSTYTSLFNSQEPPGTYYNWMTAIDISNDGSYIACGTLNFLSSTTYDGKIKLWKTSNGATPVLQIGSMGDEVQGMAFSKDSRFLLAGSWGDINNLKADFNLLRIKADSSYIMFSINSPGSFFDCTISDDGTSAIAGGKKVPARTFGNGGELYNVWIDTTGIISGINPGNQSPQTFKLHQNYPNPFNSQTRIDYEIPQSGIYKISLYDVLGKEIMVLRNSYHIPGNYSLLFDAVNLSSGIYFYKITSDKFNDMKQMMFVK